MTLLSSDDYLEGVLCLALSLRDTDPGHPLLVLVAPDLQQAILDRLSHYNLSTRTVGENYRLPAYLLARKNTPRWLKTFDKLEIFDLVEYDKVVYLDADMLVLRNIDHLFDRPHPSAAVYHGRVPPYQDWNFPNAGLLVIQPSPGLGAQIFACLPEVAENRDDLGDQVLLHHFYTPIFRERGGAWELSVMYNACAFALDPIIKQHELNFSIDAPDERTVAVVHFSSHHKPWAMSLGFIAYLIARKIAGRKWHELRAYRRYHHYLRKVRRNR